MVWARLNSMAGRWQAVFYQSGATGPPPLPVVPHRLQIARQRWQRAEVGPALAFAVVIGAARREQAEFARDAGEFHELFRSMAAGDDLDARSSAILELGEELAHLGLVELVAARVSHDRDAAARDDPAHRV